MVVMDRQDYINISNNLLAQPVSSPILRDPTNKINAKLITLLKKVKNQTGLDSNIYKAMYPIGCSTLKFYGLPRPDIPLRPILSSHGSVTYEVANMLTKILKLLKPPPCPQHPILC